MWASSLFDWFVPLFNMCFPRQHGWSDRSWTNFEKTKYAHVSKWSNKMHQQVCLKEFTQWNHYQVRITVLFGVKVERGVLRWKYTLKIHVMHRSVFFEKRIEGILAGLLVRGARKLASLAAAPLSLSSHPSDLVWTAELVFQFETCNDLTRVFIQLPSVITK